MPIFLIGGKMLKRTDLLRADISALQQKIKNLDKKRRDLNKELEKLKKHVRY